MSKIDKPRGIISMSSGAFMNVAKINVNEIIAILLSVGAFFVSLIAAVATGLTGRAAAKKGYVDTLLSAITGLQDENKRLFDRITSYGNKLNEFQIIMDEREKRIHILEASLRDATVGRAERAMYIQELEGKVKELQSRVDLLEKEVKRLETTGVSNNTSTVHVTGEKS